MSRSSTWLLVVFSYYLEIIFVVRQILNTLTRFWLEYQGLVPLIIIGSLLLRFFSFLIVTNFLHSGYWVKTILSIHMSVLERILIIDLPLRYLFVINYIFSDWFVHFCSFIHFWMWDLMYDRIYFLRIVWMLYNRNLFYLTTNFRMLILLLSLI